MSLFGKSFERELGKNTGKFVSNVIFGDKHSTPYRRVSSTTYREPRKTQAELRHELESQRIAAEERIQIIAENKRRKMEQNLLIDSAVLKNVDMISSIKISNNSEQIVDLLLGLSIQVKTNKWHKNNEEGKIRNKYNEALLEKYNQTFIRLKTIAPNHSQIEYFEKSLKSFKKKRFLKKNQTLIILVSIILAVFSVFLLVEGFFTIVFGPIAFIAIAIYGYKYYRRNQKSDEAKTTNIKYVQEERKVEETINLEEDNVIEDSIFFDLNENERIEKELFEIWNRYNRKIDNQIINRKPIFSADGVNDCILFVGINPSYNPSDDNTFVKSNDENSLMYGSFYQLPDAPKYFKALEFFANKVNKGYTHINLLYARENDRDLLLNTDHNFIREQLELTYETILKIKPVAIFFFSDYCKDLIFGADRWVNPSSESNGSYVLNGTNFPVFFTNDITSMTAVEQIELINKLEQIISKQDE